MRRWTIRIGVLLILGAIVNVAVAWGCVLIRTPFREIADMPWPIAVPPGYSKPSDGFGNVSRGFSQFGAWVDTPGGSFGSLSVQLAGWPRRSLYAERHYVKTGLGIPGTPRYDSPDGFLDGIAIPDWVKRNEKHRCFPTRPLWPGFAINTLFYAFIVWLLFFAPFALRRRWRMKRGRCVRCGYDLQGNAGGAKCPECGASLSTA